jgi:hypothetical protein
MTGERTIQLRRDQRDELATLAAQTDSQVASRVVEMYDEGSDIPALHVYPGPE